MKHIFSRTTLMLIAFLSLERFTYASIHYNVPLYLASQLKENFSDIKAILGFVGYLPLLSFTIIGFTFDKFKKATNLRFYFIPIIISFLLMFIKAPVAFVIGYSIIMFVGPFIKINVILKIYDYLKSISKNDDRSYILMIITLNIFSALAPIVVGSLRTTYNLGLILPLLNIIVWLIFGLLYFLLPCQDNLPATLNNRGNSFKYLLYSTAGIIILMFFSSYLWSSLFVEDQDYTFELKQGIIQMSVLLIIGVSLLFISNFKSRQKLNLSAVIILILGLMCISLRFIDSDSISFPLLDTSIGLRSVFDIVFYPALFFMLLDTFNFKYRAALISLFYFIDFFLPNISGSLRFINHDYLIAIIFTILVFGYLIMKFRPSVSAVHN